LKGGTAAERGEMLTNRFIVATEMACRIHAEHTRKGTEIPYTSHLLSVAALVLENGGDEDLAIAGLLHDALEDSLLELVPAIRAEILELFGPRVLGVVEACTDGLQDAAGRKAAVRERKERYLEHLAHANDDTLLVSACDKLHNARAIVRDLHVEGSSVFKRFSAGRDGTLWYYDAISKLLASRKPGALTNQLLRCVAEMQRLAGEL
jgi:(p)ppGpp synthase/HD superfamily hydrolase